MCCDLLQTNRNFKNTFLPSVPGFSCKGLFQGENGTKHRDFHRTKVSVTAQTKHMHLVLLSH